MSTINNGGPAFPHIDSGCGRFDPGMTLRDYFAAKAMEGLLANSEGVHSGAEPTEAALFDAKRGAGIADEFARLSYRIADAMLRARSA